ncbi:MAG: alkaline phosphatase D family protein [Burkholderiales bacterium]|jgi:alkaline phosphatase D|nr:alkaline phosphatase D family protein [Burkholderiales bacterium]
MNRRDTLATLSRGAALLAWGSLFGAVQRPARATSALPRGEYPFTLGVASGMTRPDSVVLWTRLAPRPHAPLGGLPDAPIDLRWQLASDEAFSRGVRSGTFTARPEHGHSVHVQVSGLASASAWFYRFMVGDAVSAVGRTRTAPAADAAVARLRIALASCQHYEQGAFAAHRDIAEHDLDVVLFVGDYIYESSNPRYRLRPHEGPPPQTLAAYRARHATYKLDADLQAAHAAHPWLLTWDDHEVENDYANDQSPSGMRSDEFLARRAAAYKAYFEHMPVAPSMAPHGAAMRIHDQFTWGRLAELWTLDSRQYRSVQACGEPGRGGGRVVSGCDDLGFESRSLFGAEQEQWLARGLAGSERRWKLLGQGSQICPGGIDSPLGRRIYSDGWDGYPRARERFLDAIAKARNGNVVCLSGDVHRHLAAQLRSHGNQRESPIVAAEFVCSSLTSRGVSEAVMALMRASNPDIVHGRSDERGYALIDVTPDATSCEFRATPFPAKPQAKLSPQASFVVEAGRPGVATA